LCGCERPLQPGRAHDPDQDNGCHANCQAKYIEARHFDGFILIIGAVQVNHFQYREVVVKTDDRVDYTYKRQPDPPTLYSRGKDGDSSGPLSAKASRDDIVRANNGGFIGLGEDY